MMRRTVVVAAVCTFLVLVVVLIYLPVLGFELTGDDYQVAQAAHGVMLAPHTILEPVGQIFRPLLVLSFVLDRWLWGTGPAGYHASTLAVHVLGMLSLLTAGRRLGLGLPVAAGVALLWACAPFTDECAVWASARPDGFLMILWMAMVVLWPRAANGEEWTRARLAAAALVTAGLVLAKESWVVTPLLVLVLAMVQQKLRFRQALRPALLVAVPAVIYVAVRFLFIPSTGGYFEYSPAPLLKVPHMLAAFLWLEELRPLAFEATFTGFFALAVVLALAITGLRRRNPVMAVGATLVFVPLLPVLLVPYLPQRYTAVPWAGFLLLTTGLAALETGRLTGWRRRAFLTAVGVVGVLLLAAGAATVRADLVDWRRVSDAHRRLLHEAAAAAPGFPLDRPVVLVRAERSSPLLEISLTPRGLYKLWFPRNRDPYGLIDGSALFDWVLEPRGGVVLDLLAGTDTGDSRVLVHQVGGFRWIPPGELQGDIEGWADSGLPYRVIGLVPPKGRHGAGDRGEG